MIGYALFVGPVKVILKKSEDMILKCLALACSPRKNGNTALLAQRALEACAQAGCDTEFLYLTDYRYAPCRACEGCNDTGTCVIRDDARIVYDKILAADRLILAAPIFSMGINAQAKMFIDRAQQFWAAKYVLDKNIVPSGDRPARQGIFISCAGTTLPGVFDGSVRVVRYFFKMLDIQLVNKFCYAGVDKKGDILSKDTAFNDIYQYVKNHFLTVV